MISLIVIMIPIFLSPVFCYTNRIIGGREIMIQEAPYQGALFHKTTFKCGASLISANFAITAAHCIDCYTCPARQYSVLVGTNNLEENDGMHLKVKRKFMHPNYEFPDFNYDFALLELYTVDLLPEVVQFVKIPRLHDSIAEGDNVLVSGWGMTESSSDSKVLLAADIPVYNQKKCANAYSQLNIEITDKMICAGFAEGNIDSCYGDSGGPMVGKSDGILYGVVSFGNGCAKPGFPGVYAKVSSVLEWIYKIVPYLP